MTQRLPDPVVRKDHIAHWLDFVCFEVKANAEAWFAIRPRI